MTNKNEDAAVDMVVFGKEKDTELMVHYLSTNIGVNFPNVPMVSYDGKAWREHGEALNIGPAPSEPFCVLNVGDRPCIYVDAAYLRRSALEKNEIEVQHEFDSAIYSECVTADQITRGDLIVEVDKTTWMGKEYTVDDVPALTRARVDLLASHVHLTEDEMRCVTAIILPWELEKFAFSIAAVGKIYESRRDNVWKILVVDWYEELRVKAESLKDDGDLLSERLLAFPQGTPFYVINDFIDHMVK